MEEVKSEEMYMEDLDGWILEENKVKHHLTKVTANVKTSMFRWSLTNIFLEH